MVTYQTNLLKNIKLEIHRPFKDGEKFYYRLVYNSKLIYKQ